MNRAELSGALRGVLAPNAACQVSSKLPRRPALSDDELGRMNTLLQLENLRSHPLVREAEQTGATQLRAWFFDIGTGEIESHDSSRGWQPIGAEYPIGPLRVVQTA